MHSAPILAPRPVSDALHRVQRKRTIAGYIVDAIEPIAMLALVGLALGCLSRSSQKGFLIFASIALALTAARRLNNAIVAWTDLQDLTTYSWLVAVMWAPTVAAWMLAWNRWGLRPWRSIDVSAVVLAGAGIISAMMHSARVTSGSRLASIALFVVIGARIVRSGPTRILALVTLATIMAGLFGGELLDTIGVPGIWFHSASACRGRSTCTPSPSRFWPFSPYASWIRRALSSDTASGAALIYGLQLNSGIRQTRHN